ncbi:hypothetical protein D3C71_1618070 [compost metagenome]
MAPAHQRLGAEQSIRAEGQLGLVEHLQLALVQRLVQLRLEQQALVAAALQAVAVELRGVAAELLGVAHGHARLAEQSGRIAGAGQQADAQRGTDHQFVAAGLQALAQFGEQPARHGLELLGRQLAVE